MQNKTDDKWRKNHGKESPLFISRRHDTEVGKWSEEDEVDDGPHEEPEERTAILQDHKSAFSMLMLFRQYLTLGSKW